MQSALWTELEQLETSLGAAACSKVTLGSADWNTIPRDEAEDHEKPKSPDGWQGGSFSTHFHTASQARGDITQPKILHAAKRAR